MHFKKLEFSEQMGKLESLEIGITSKCNFRCEYCCAYKKNDSTIMTASQAIALMETAPDLKRVKLSGGEVTLELEECIKIIGYCRERGISTQINTNGSLLDETKIRRLIEAGLTTIHFSLNFMSAGEWARYYKVPEHIYQTILNSIRTCTHYPELSTVVESIMFHETSNNIMDLHRFAYSLGVRTHELQCAIPVTHSDWKSSMNQQQMIDIINTVIDQKPADSKIYISCLSAFFGHASTYRQKIHPDHEEKGVHFCRCIEGHTQLHLHANGDVLVCELGYPLVLGNVFDNPSLFEDALRNPSPELQLFRHEHHHGGRRCHELYRETMIQQHIATRLQPTGMLA